MLALFAGEVGEVVAQIAMIGEIERGAPLGNLLRGGDGVRVRAEELRHALRWPEKEFAVGPPHPV